MTPKQPAKKAAAKKPAAATSPTNPEGTEVSTTTEAPAAAPKQAAKRDYRVTRKLTLDITDPESLIAQLQALTDPDDPQPVTVYALIGVGNGSTPKDGLSNLPEDVELDGDYETIAEPNITEFKGVKAKVQRVVSIG